MTKRTTCNKLLVLAALTTLLFAASCSKEEPGAEPGATGPQIRFEIGFAPEGYTCASGRASGEEGRDADAAPRTRVATDNLMKSTWQEGDSIGVFATEHGKPLGATASDNLIHNAKLEYRDGEWIAQTPFYWPRRGTKVDFYACYPYDATVADPTRIAFSAATDQSGQAGFSRSDLLVARSDNRGAGFERGDVVSLAFSHQMAMVEVKVSKSMLGDYAPEALAVWLDGCRPSLVLDLADGAVSGSSSPPRRIRMYPCPLDAGGGTFAYRALAAPGDIAQGTVMFRFDYDGREQLASLPLATAVQLEGGRAERFDMSFPFTSVAVSSQVRVADLLQDAPYATITHLKVLGEMNDADFGFINSEMPALVSLDLGGATVKGNAIPGWAFSYKKGLQEFVFPKGITSIKESAFERCEGLTGSLTIPSSVTSIGESAFEGCKGFTGSLTIPASVATIGKSAFHGCVGLTGSLTIPYGVTSIGESAFDGCAGFTGSLTIPASVVSIGESAFSMCQGLTGSLTIPASVATIGKSAFHGCVGLTGSLTLPSGIETIPESAFAGCGFTGTLAIPSSVTSIGEKAFDGCAGFTGTLAIPSSVVSIGESAFSMCRGLTGSLTIPSGIETIPQNAFYVCAGLNGELIISEGVKTIGADAFWGCQIASLAIPSSVGTIFVRAFSNCTLLTTITCRIANPDQVTYGENVFFNTNVTEVYVPAQAVELYKAHPVWSQFADKIKAIP